MGEEFKDFETSTPTLTLEPDISTPAAAAAAVAFWELRQ